MREAGKGYVGGASRYEQKFRGVRPYQLRRRTRSTGETFCETLYKELTSLAKKLSKLGAGSQVLQG